MFFTEKCRNSLKTKRDRRKAYFVAAGIAFYMVFIGLFSVQAAELSSLLQAVREPPEVVVSIKPLHSLVSAVMQNVASPALIVRGAGSEHGYQLRPQDAKNLSKADIIFWAGPQMESFLQKPLRNLSPGAEIIALSEAPGIVLLPMREGGAFETHYDVSGYEHGAAAAESSKNADLHFWLDPQNAKAALSYIDKILSEKDPARAALYHENTKIYRQRLDELMSRVNAELVPVRGRPFIVFHDAYQYFERRFAIPAAGSVAVNPEQAPGARRMALMRAKIKKLASGNVQADGADGGGQRMQENSARIDGQSMQTHSARAGGRRARMNICVFSEPQFEPRLVQTIIEGTNAKTGTLDPLGGNLPSGPDQYFRLTQNLADSLKQCLMRE